MGRTITSSEEKAATRRMRGVTAENCGKVVAKDCYWNIQFLRLYRDRCDAAAADDPRAGYTFASYLPLLTERVRVSEGESREYFPSERVKRSELAISEAVKGSCCRAGGYYVEAEVSFRLAFDYAGAENDPAVWGEVKRRKAALLFQMSKPEESLALIEEALAAFEGKEEGNGNECIADALVLRGLINVYRQRKGAADFSEAMSLADRRTARGRRTFEAGLQNLAVVATLQSVCLTDQEEAYRLLQGVRKVLANSSNGIRKAKVYWTEGLLLRNMGIGRHALRKLNKARDGLLRLGSYTDCFLVSLDIALLLLEDSEGQLLDELVAGTSEILKAGTFENDGAALAVSAWLAAPKDTGLLENARCLLKA